MNGPVPASWSPVLLSLVRIVAAFGLMTHGTQKLFGVPTVDPRAGVELLSRAGTAGIIETVGGALLIVGLFTRPVAFLCSGLMAAAYFIAHWPRNFWPILNGGELAAVYCFLFLYLAATGGGPLSIDAMMRGKRR
ncbi:MAG: DoxX family protein [Acidobacteria bacterium]|nr:DoxX family protein [Acidobacteriota bacterium]